MIEAARDAGRRAGIADPVAKLISLVERRRRDLLGDDYTPPALDEWPGATEAELELALALAFPEES